ncbi:MAG: 3-oxoacid CoA-transferase [Lachnospiraceae bacterium]|nr:3-oxoacid CoA-transferase [Lachnospiraceae bacterium]
MVKILSATEAIAEYIKDGDTIAFGGFVGAAHPEELSVAIQKRFLEQGSPRNLTVVYAAGQGDGKERGLNHLGEEGLVGKLIGGHWGLVPRLQKLALENKVAAYNLPQGVISHMYRDIAAGKPGVITHVGLGTFVDPRLEGGKLNEKAAQEGDMVQLIELGGEEKLFYPAFPIHVSIIRATYADTNGNCTFQREGIVADAIAMAQAAKNSGGHVIVQVEKIVDYKTLDTRLVKLPGIYVDALVVSDPANHMQTFATQYNPAFSGEVRMPVKALSPMKLDARKVVVRRAAMELKPRSIINLGIGMPEGVAAIAAEEGIENLTLTTEAGTNGGFPAAGGDFGVTTNPDCILEQPSQFDFYDGGGLDLAFLGLAQTDREGNVNVSKFGTKIAGCGGFINISQNAKKVVFCGTFTAGGLEVAVNTDGITILQEGRSKKFLQQVEQITFSGAYAKQAGQTVLYITERAVLELTSEGIELREIAPGVDLEKDILAQMDFPPIIKDVKYMDRRLFAQGPMGLVRA